MTDYKQLCRKLADRLREANELLFYKVETSNYESQKFIEENWELLAEVENELAGPDVPNSVNDFIEKIIPIILYGDIDETPLDVIKDHCKLNEQGEIDWYAINEFDEEQQLRMAIAATLRGMKEDT